MLLMMMMCTDYNYYLHIKSLNLPLEYLYANMLYSHVSVRLYSIVSKIESRHKAGKFLYRSIVKRKTFPFPNKSLSRRRRKLCMRQATTVNTHNSPIDEY